MSDWKDRIQVHIEGKAYSVVGGSFQDMLAAVKLINGRRFVGELKVWQLPGTVQQIKSQLELGGFQLEGGAAVAGQAAAPAPARSGGDRIKLMVQGRELAVVGGDFQSMLAAVKNLPGRRFDPDSKSWEVPGGPAIIKQLIEAAGFQLKGADEALTAPPPEMETPDFGPATEPPPYEEPDFLWDESDAPPYEPPDWWDDDNAPPPPPSPPDWGEDEPLPPDEPPPAPVPARG